MRSVVGILLVVAVLAAPAQAATDAAPAAAPATVLTDSVTAADQAVSALEAELADATGDNREVVEQQLAEAKETLKKGLAALIELANKKQDTAEGRAEAEGAKRLAVELLSTQSKALRQRVVAARKITVELGAKQVPQDPAELVKFEKEIAAAHDAVDAALREFWDNARRLESLGQDLKEQYAFLDSELKGRAEDAATLYRLVNERLTKLGERKDPADDAEKAARAKEKEALEAKRASAKDALTTAIALMEERGLDVDEYKQVLISLSGEITTDILDKDVAVGLFTTWVNNGKEWLVANTPVLIFKALVFLVILLLFKVAAGFVQGVVRKGLSSSRLQISKLLEDFFVSMSGKAVMIVGFLVAVSQLGVELGPLLAGLGVAGFIVGFALQSTLSNFASGLMILIYRPYDVGHLIEVGGHLGTVAEMTLVSTTILTLDNQRLILPNNKVWGDVIRNVNVESKRRVDLVFGISYADDVENAQRVLEEIVKANDKVLDEPEAVVRLHTLNDSSVDFIVRPWCTPENYWFVHWEITEAVKKRFDAEGISIPFPQRDVHLYKVAS